MTKLKIIALLTGALLLLTLAYIFRDSFIIRKGVDGPCAVTDSVNITGHQKFPNGSYSYEGLIVPEHLWKNFTSTINDFSIEIPAEPHVRGCICKFKTCIKFCCPRTQFYNGTDCVAFKSNKVYPNKMNITTRNGELREVDVTKEFGIQYGRACERTMYFLEPPLKGADSFNLFENGSLYRWFDKVFLSKDEFCLSAYNTYILLPMNCVLNTKMEETKVKIFAWVMFFSVPFMILTMIVYMALPELRTLHGKSLCCYLLGQCCGFLILAALNLKPFKNLSMFKCKLFGFSAYFSFMASFLWLSVIGFDIFYNIRSPSSSSGGRHNENKRFILYSIYALGLALLSLCITYFAKESSLIPNHWKPAIATDKYCWFDVRNGWSAMIYFYSPIVIIISFNIVVFILTALQIHKIQREVNHVMKNDDTQKKIRTEKERFGIFLRLFIIMGVAWSIEIISYMVGSNSLWSQLFNFIDVINCIQGYLIFALLVWKKKVKIYIINRYLPQRFSQRNSQSSSNKTTSSNINLPMNGIKTDKMVINKIVETQS